jgi:hypothetical protein
MDIVAVVRRWQAGESQRGIAAPGLARETVSRYLAAAGRHRTRSRWWIGAARVGSGCTARMGGTGSRRAGAARRTHTQLGSA